MHAFDVLGDPIRRRILELLSMGETASGDIVNVISKEFGISQPAVSYQLRVLRENGFASVRPQAQQRFYSVNTQSLTAIEDWLNLFRRMWDPKLDALAAEVSRGRTKK